MPSGVVCFDAVLGNVPSQLIIDGLLEHIEAPIYNFRCGNSSLSLFTLFLAPHSVICYHSVLMASSVRRHPKIRSSTRMDSAHSPENFSGVDKIRFFEVNLLQRDWMQTFLRK